MIVEKDCILQTEGKKPILYDIYYNESKTTKPGVIFCHGYKGFKDWGAWHLVAEAFANAGFFFAKFNFSHNGGTIEQPIDFPDLEAFAQNNFTTELNDLQYFIDYLSSEKKYSTELKRDNLNLIGHSRGGGIVLIKAEEHTAVKKVVTWASVCDFKARFQVDSEAFKLWKKTGRTYVENSRTKQRMPHDWQFYENFVANEERLTIKRAAKGLKIPQLIVHGSEDSTVLVKEAKEMHAWNPNSLLKVINGGDHVFGACHPWDNASLPQHLKQAVDETIKFLKGS